jgi:hypothetical protein
MSASLNGSVSRLASVGLAALAVGCAPESPDEEIGVAAQAALHPNALHPNALHPNALHPNALHPNALHPNALRPDALSPAAAGSIEDPGEDGDLSRELLRYTVSCAFAVDQSFDFSWTDGEGATHAESYPGLVGLAPSWATQALERAGQQWVSNCLAARVNALGVSVMLSARGRHPALATTAAERAAYQTREAVFFGNLFTDSPRVYACYDPLSVLPAQMADRVCAQPLALDLADLSLTYDCGPISVLGPCTDVLGLVAVGACGGLDLVGRYFYNCRAPGSPAVVPSETTFLKGPLPL